MNKFDRLSQEEKDLLLTDMYEALKNYEKQCCEGYCSDWPKDFTPDPKENDCQGCLARTVLAKVQQ